MYDNVSLIGKWVKCLKVHPDFPLFTDGKYYQVCAAPHEYTIRIKDDSGWYADYRPVDFNDLYLDVLNPMDYNPYEPSISELVDEAKQYIEKSKVVGSSEFPRWQEPHIQQQPQESAPLYGGKTEEEWLWIFAGQAMHGCLVSDVEALHWSDAEELSKRVLMYSQALIEELKKQTEQQ